MISRRTFLTTLALGVVAKAAEIRPSGGMIRGGRINYAATYDADAQDFFTRAEAVGTISAATKTAFNTWVLAAKANGYWSKIIRGNMFIGDSLAVALVPYKVGGGNATDTNTNFVEGDYSLATGLTGNGTTKYLDTGLLGSALTANDTHLAVYNRGSSAVGGNVGIGASSALNLYAPFFDGRAYSYQYDNGTGAVFTAGALGTPFGFVLSTRTAANSHTIYRNGSSASTNATSGGALPTIALFVFANNNAGTANNLTSHNFAAYSVGAGLTAGNAASYYTDLQAAMTSFGRAVAP